MKDLYYAFEKNKKRELSLTETTLIHPLYDYPRTPTSNLSYQLL